MKIDNSIAQLAARLDKWFESDFEALTGEDLTDRGQALVGGIEIVKALDRIKADGLNALSRLIGEASVKTDEEQVALLVRAFEFGAKLKHTLSDELSDVDGANAAVGQTNAITERLDAIGSGRRLALAPLLKHTDAGLRVSAAAYLIGLIPERALPVLREVNDSERANSAHFTAFWAIARWESETR